MQDCRGTERRESANKLRRPCGKVRISTELYSKIFHKRYFIRI